MAAGALKKLEEQLNCSICLDTYTDPKLLQCFHVYCRQCLVRLVVRNQQGQLGLTCPTCRQVTPVPDRGVVSLQSAFHINDLLEIQDAFQKCEFPAEEAVGGSDFSTPLKYAFRHCFEHPEEELKLYCETCGELVCYKCALKGGKHQSHDYDTLAKAYQKYKEEIASSLEPMEKQVATIMKALAQLDTRCGEISDQRAATEDSIHISFRRLREVLDVRETELVGQLDRMTQEKLESLAVQREQIETTLAQLNSCLHLMKESLRPGNEGDVLMMKANMVQQVEELSTSFEADTLQPNVNADIVFSASASNLIVACQQYGEIFRRDPLKCHIPGKDIATVMVGEMCITTVDAINYKGNPYKETSTSVKCEIVSEITGTRANCAVVRDCDQYNISYQPTIKGRHQLHIRAEGQHVRGSPFSVAAKATVEELGTPILTIGVTEGPWGVAVNQKTLVVTEVGRHCISVFCPSGERLRSFGTNGSGQGQFRDPRGIATDNEGSIVVADSWNHRIQKFAADGQFISAVGTKGSGPLQFCFPAGIAFNNGMIYVVDNDNHRVQVLNSDLTISSIFGKYGSGEGQFCSPTGVACDSTGKVYVADSGNHRVQVFTAEGKFSRVFGRRGQGRGKLDWPFGVAVDASGEVYVSESGNHRVSVFTSEGQFVTFFGTRGVELGEFHFPHGLAVDDNGVVYVCDRCNNRVQMF